MSKRRESTRVTLDGFPHTEEIEVEVLVCNRCGVKVLPVKALERGWVAVLSDGRGGRHLDFCGPLHAVEYFAELIPPHVRAARTAAVATS